MRSYRELKVSMFYRLGKKNQKNLRSEQPSPLTPPPPPPPLYVRGLKDTYTGVKSVKSCQC